MSEKYVLPDYDFKYRQYARMASVPIADLVLLVTAYAIDYAIDTKKSSCESDDDYKKLYESFNSQLGVLIWNNVKNGVIESFYNEYGHDEIPDDNTPQIRIPSFVDWAVRKKIHIPPVWVDCNLPDDLATVVNRLYAPGGATTVDEIPKQLEGGNDTKSDLMIQYAIEIGAFCNENANDDCIPTFDDVQNHMANLHGKDTVADSWIKDILKYAPPGMNIKNGRRPKILTEAIKVGFYMREWYDDNSKIDELDFNKYFKRDLPKVSIALRSKAWELLTKFKEAGK